MISVIYLYLKGDTEINFGNNPDPDIADMRFHWIDLNKDGSITFDEFSFVFGKRYISILNKISRGDGTDFE